MSAYIDTDKNKKPLISIPSEELRDFLGWTIFADPEIDIDEDDVQYYSKQKDENKWAVLLVVKGKKIYCESFTEELAGNAIIKMAAMGYFKSI